MNGDQVKGILQIVATYVGPPIVAWLVKLGVTPEQIGTWGNALINTIAATVPIAMAVWSWFANKRITRSKSVASIPGAMVVVDPEKAPHELVMAAINPAEPDIITTHEAARKLLGVQATPKDRAFGPSPTQGTK